LFKFTECYVVVNIFCFVFEKFQVWIFLWRLDFPCQRF
jgi:hypothetical protein